MLYAQVIVAKRTNVEDLTYAVPAAIVPYIRLGSLVTVPLRRSLVRGVVVAMRRTIPVAMRSKIRDIVSIEKVALQASQVEVIHKLADYYGSSVAEVAYHALTSPSSISSDEATSEKIKSKTVFLQSPWHIRKEEYAKVITSSEKPTLLLFSQKSYADDWAKDFRNKISGKEVIIGTIKDAFTPIPPHSQIIVDQPYHIGGKSSRRPYMTTRTVATFRSLCEGHTLVFGSELLGFREVLAAQRRELQLKTELPEVKDYFITVSAPRDVIHPSIIERIEKAVAEKKRILFFTASKGWAPSLYCHECQQTVLCRNCQRPVSLSSKTEIVCNYCSNSQTFSSHCQHCGKDSVVALGYGAAQIVKTLQEAFPQISVTEVSGSSLSGIDAQLVVATEKILSFPEVFFDEVIVLHTDRLLTGALLDGSWQLFGHLIELQSRCQSMTVQTVFPEHAIWGKLTKEKFQRYFAAELRSRKEYRLPPYGSHIRLISRASSSQRKKDLNPIVELLSQKNLSHSEVLVSQNASLAIIEVYSDRPFSLAIRRALQESLPLSWHIDIDL